MGERVGGEVAVREAQAVGVVEAADVRVVNGGYRCAGAAEQHGKAQG